MMMNTYKFINKVDFPSETLIDPSANNTIWWLLAAGFIYYLADTLLNDTSLASNFVSLLQETSLESALSKAEHFDFSLLSKNDLSTSTMNLPVNVTLNVNSIQLIIFHAKEQLMLLGTVNPDFSLNIHERAIINESSDVTNLNDIYDRFLNCFSILVSTQTQPISVQTTIITKTDLEFFYSSEPFIPILDILTEYPFHLSAYVYDIPTINLHLHNLGFNLHLLEVFENNLIHHNGVLNNLVTMAENLNLDRQPLWSYYQAHGQLWRYIVTIRNVYTIMG